MVEALTSLHPVLATSHNDDESPFQLGEVQAVQRLELKD